MSNDTVMIRLQKGTYSRDLLWRVSIALCLLVSTQRNICANRLYHSIGWCEACGPFRLNRYNCCVVLKQPPVDPRLSSSFPSSFCYELDVGLLLRVVNQALLLYCLGTARTLLCRHVNFCRDELQLARTCSKVALLLHASQLAVSCNFHLCRFEGVGKKA